MREISIVPKAIQGGFEALILSGVAVEAIRAAHEFGYVLLSPAQVNAIDRYGFPAVVVLGLAYSFYVAFRPNSWRP